MTRHGVNELPEGAVFQGRYRILRCIKAGGMGAVYECEHLTTRKRRALKVMLPSIVASKDMRERFELESRVTANIESDHIVETFDSGVDTESGAPFLVMELLRGEDLERLLEVRGPFSPDDTVTLLAQVALALDRTHGAGVVHRDLKPQNLFLTRRDDGSPRMKILDFGIAKVVADGTRTVQQTGAMGTPVYMAPEQATGDGTIGPRADLYALGHIAYSLLTGIPYWLIEQTNNPVFAFLSRMIAGAVEPPSARAARLGRALPPAFDAWFMRATAPSPALRFDRASTQIAELAAALGVRAPRELLATPRPGGEWLPIPAPAAPAFVCIGTTSTVVAAAPSPRTTGTIQVVMGTPTPPPRASRAGLLAALVIGVMGLAGGAALIVRSSAPGSASTSGPSDTVTATADSAGAPAVRESAPVASTSAPVASASAKAVEPASPPAVPTSAPGPMPAPAHESPSIAAPQPTASPKPPTAPAKSCDPPYTVDSRGHHHPKRGCF